MTLTDWLHVTTTHLLLFPSLTTFALVQGQQERLTVIQLDVRPACVWCHPTQNCDLIQKTAPENYPERWDRPHIGQTKGPLVPICLELLPPIKKLNFFVIGGVNIKLSDFPAQVTDCRGRKKNSTGVSLVSAVERFSSDIGTIFYSVLFLVGEKTQNSLLYIVTIVLPLIQFFFCLLSCVVRLPETWKQPVNWFASTSTIRKKHTGSLFCNLLHIWIKSGACREQICWGEIRKM